MTTNNQPIRFIHSSDWQLGMTRVFLDKDSAPRFSQARIDAIATLGKLAVEHDAQFIIVAGVEVVGAPWRTKHPSSDLCYEMAQALEPANDIIRIAVAHGQVDSLSPETSQPATA